MSRGDDNKDAKLEPSWSADAVFALPEIASMPELPGVLMLVRGSSPSVEQAHVVWVEAPENLRFRARELAGHATVGPELGAILMHADLRFRYATIEDSTTRREVLESVRDRVRTD